MNNTAAHTAEQAHDAKLLDLLFASADANTKLARQREYARSAAASYSEFGGKFASTGNGPATRITLDDMPVGTLYETRSYGRSRTDVATVVRGDTNFDRVASDQQVREALAAKAASAPDGYYEKQDAERAEKLLASWAAAEGAALHARVAIADHEVNYTGWSRFFLVTSSTGHVHSSMGCSTCNPMTTFAPVVRLSGSTDAEALELVGETLCTVCFPDAPVDGRPSKLGKKAVKALLG